MAVVSAVSVRQRLAEGLAGLQLEATGEQIDALARLAEMVASWGRRMNLSGHRGAERVAQHLVLDAAALLARAPDFESLADLGSGAGFPGLPVAILRPQVRVTLVESRQRRHHFQRAARRELGLTNAEPLLGRAEELEPRPHAAAVAQAMARPSRVLAWMLPWVQPGGWLLLPAGAASPAFAVPPQCRFQALRRYEVPGTGVERSLWIGRRG